MGRIARNFQTLSWLRPIIREPKILKPSSADILEGTAGSDNPLKVIVDRREAIRGRWKTRGGTM
jgi:hypothetical protein